MDKFLYPFRQSKLLNALFLSNIFISFHYALIIYINSAFLANFFSEIQISALYIISAVANTILLLSVSRIIEKFGSYKLITLALIIEFLTTIGMAFSEGSTVGLYFLIHSVAISVIYFSMDLFVESAATDESKTGSIRATYLTIANITIVCAPVAVAFILSHNNYPLLYVISSLVITPLWYLLRRFKIAPQKPVQHISLRSTVSEYLKNSDLSNIFVSSFLLQLFYAFMVVYVPLYLEKYIGFAWSEIGIMFTIMLLPFVLLEVPVGELEDGKYTEREFLTIGFIVMGLSTLFISFLSTKSFWVWTTVLFITRVGASLVEVSNESYFFKRVNQDKTDVISFFRITRPLSFLVAPIIATIALQFISFQYIFIIVGVVMLIGVRYSLALHNKIQK